MSLVPTHLGRRAFLTRSALAGGGLMLSFNWLASCELTPEETSRLPKEWFGLNGFVKIGDNGLVTIMAPNPEGGQNVKTSMPMIVADELDADWEKVVVEQAPLNAEAFSFQWLGGSQAIRRGWPGLRLAGASARHMLRTAAANAWGVPFEEVTTEIGMLYHKASGKSAHYGEMATAAAQVEVPEEVELKDKNDFSLIGTSRKNVDGPEIVTGKPLFGSDTKKEGMLYAMIVHPPAFGLRMTSFDDSTARGMPGIRDIFPIRVLEDSYQKQHFDTLTFPEVVAIVGDSTWEVMQAKKALRLVCEPIQRKEETRVRFGGTLFTEVTPAGLESTRVHREQMEALAAKPGTTVRRDGDPEQAFRGAAQVIERSYSGPFLAHNCMEPMNFFAHVTTEKAELAGPLQKPDLTEHALSERLGLPIENIEISMTRLGGAFGRRSYAHWALEAALISRKMGAPVNLIYTREDDMTAGIYRPSYHAKFRAGLDADGNLVAFHVKAGGIPESPLHADRFPAGAVDNYLAEEWTLETNLTIGSFRAPRSNFMAAAEQSFLDEVAEAAGKDPIAFRLELLERARTNPVGERNDYDAARYAGVLELVRDKAGWGTTSEGVFRGVSAYFCHNSYAAQVLDLVMENGQPRVQKVTCALDCGIVINPDAAINLTEGGITDGIGNALYGELTISEGVIDKSNFDTYRLIRMREAPREIDVHFVENEIDPTGLGEPMFPPVFAALANALYQATGKRYYHQPFTRNQPPLVG